MTKPRLAPDMTPEERYACKVKPKVPDAIYNLSEAVVAAQLYWRKVFPNDAPISRNKIRALYLFLFDVIIHSLTKDALISLHHFGTFERKFREAAPIQEHISGQKMFRRAHYRVTFKPCKRFKDIINNDHLNAFHDTDFLLDELYEDELENQAATDVNNRTLFEESPSVDGTNNEA
jgi:nucleoid DNA-binding protein